MGGAVAPLAYISSQVEDQGRWYKEPPISGGTQAALSMIKWRGG
jgi:hypothetical protein